MGYGVPHHPGGGDGWRCGVRSLQPTEPRGQPPHRPQVHRERRQQTARHVWKPLTPPPENPTFADI